MSVESSSRRIVESSDVEADIELLGESSPNAGPNDADFAHRVAAAASAARVFGEDVALLLVAGPDAELLYASSHWALVAGDPTAPSPGRPLREALRPGRLAPADWADFMCALDAAIVGGASALIPLTVEDPDRGRRHLEGRPYRPSDRTGNVVIAFHDVTTRWTEISELEHSERRFRLIAEATDDMVTETDAAGRFTYVSPACTRVLGHTAEEFLARSPMFIHHEEDREVFLRDVVARRKEGEPFTVVPHRLRRKDGSWIWVEATGVRHRRPDGEMRLVGVARDITARLRAERVRQQLEEQLRSSQKLESLGVLAGGIAHDFNNYLTPIVGSAGLLSLELPADSPLLARVELIRKAARRATDLTAQMLSYAGGTELHLASLDLSEAIRSMHLLLESAATHRARLIYDLDPDLPRVTADDGQLGQVVMNLVSNAAESFGDAGGRIEISTGLLEADRETLLDYYLGDQREPGTFVYVEVKDDGVGIDEQTRDHIFDPFFSTKFTGRGLGLAVVLGIVKGHTGALQIDSSPEGGTRFRILLPTRPADVGSTRDRSDARHGQVPEALKGTFLVVDDDEDAREITSILLERAGFDVLAESHGEKGVETFRKHPGQIAGVVLDNTMPGFSGTQVFDAIRQIEPQVPIILVSGYARERISSSLLARGRTRFLHKPFDADQLLASVRELFDAD